MTPRPPSAPAERAFPAVLVVGMHRSGTSAIASGLGSLGLSLPAGKDVLGPRHGNDRGHFESISLLQLSDEVLKRLGGSWDDPPPAPATPQELASFPELTELAARGGEVFAAAFPDRDRPACWKDPRTALLLGYWRAAIERPLAAVLCVRHPLEVARSLERRDALDLPFGLALWERYTRRAMVGLAGLPVLVTSYAEALADPASWKEQAAAWLAWLGWTPEGEPGELPFEPELRHEGASAGDGAVLATQLMLYEQLLQACGPHESFGLTPAAEESPWSGSVIQAHGDGRKLWRAIDWLGSELAEQLLTATPLSAPKPGGAKVEERYPLNATEDEKRYWAWLEERGESHETPRERAREVAATREGQPLPRPRHEPMFSIVMPCYRPPIRTFDRAVASVLEQSFEDWQLCICDDASNLPALAGHLSEVGSLDPRIETTTRSSNGGISAATNDAIAMARGRYVVFLDHDDELTANALQRIALAIEDNPGVDLLYSDEDKIDEHGRRVMPSFKPDWSPDLLLSNAYMCHVLVLRRHLLTELGGLRPEFDGAQDYDLMLRTTEHTRAIVHIPDVLYHWRMTAGSASGDAGAKPWAFEAGRRAIADAAARRGIDARVDHHPRVAGSYNLVRRPASGGLVSAIIPFRDEPALTAACYRSFIENPGYDNFELLLVDNDSALPETRALLEDLARDRRVRLLEAPGPFDWVAINNEAARKARGDLLLFLNNDIEARSIGWLGHLVAQAEREDVGAVGARLLYPDGTIQHAGVVVGVGWGATHVQQGLSAEEPGYLSLTTIARNYSAVTGACLMSRRSVFEEVGGFDGNLPIAFNDIDYCLRLRQLGLLVVYTPLAEMIHYESKSRGHSDDVTEAPFFRRRWRSLMLAGDPYYNRNLGRFDNNCRLPNEEDEERWATFLSMLDAS